MHEAREARTAAGRGPLQHRKIAVGIAEREDRPPSDKAVDADRLAGAVIDKLDLFEFEQFRLAAGAHLKLHDTR